ncbi:MAG: 2-oxo acid dehydrogenase subunit E2 [Chlamydiae bacterium]|nr:2-oxo acid dehydrogenase subunit E2 [Chlamydiota bacterium]
MENEVKISLPKLGESIVSAVVVQWFKKEGEHVEVDEPLLEVSTDKVNSEIPSPVAGILQKIVAPAETELQVGETLALVSTQVGERMTAPAKAPSKEGDAVPQDREDFLSPSVMRCLQEKKISLSEIDRIPRTGQGGRLTKQDVDRYTPSASKATSPSICPHQKASNDVERVKMSAMRKAIADNMVKSFYEAPHASLVTEVDVTSLMQLIQEQKAPFLEQHQAKLTITPFVARAICRSLSEYPLLNASLDGGDTIVMKRFVNLGVAVSVDQGVMVPVLQHCQALSIPQISKQIADLALKAREHRLTPADVQEGTMTMTNFGMTGTLIGIPIIRYPEVAIVGLGAISKKVAAMPDNSIAIRSVMMVSLTFDHRVLDGLYGCGFLSALKKHLESDISL